MKVYWSQRRLLRIFEADPQTSEVLVLAIAKIDLRGRIEQQQLRWPGHLSRSQ
jgi:hypothetical protein